MKQMYVLSFSHHQALVVGARYSEEREENLRKCMECLQKPIRL